MVSPTSPFPSETRRKAPIALTIRVARTDPCAFLQSDPGKTTQVCRRDLWELGREPNLRIKIVCASEAIALDRSRFLRRSIERNP